MEFYFKKVSHGQTPVHNLSKLSMVKFAELDLHLPPKLHGFGGKHSQYTLTSIRINVLTVQDNITLRKNSNFPLRKNAHSIRSQTSKIKHQILNSNFCQTSLVGQWSEILHACTIRMVFFATILSNLWRHRSKVGFYPKNGWCQVSSLANQLSCSTLQSKFYIISIQYIVS